ncbi:hypothetical protein [uncultured Sulfitobacter sp.]|uniref:hypothetical protein n=1 Tax=uncultured Sulfitobacter sp. TaxID=191468 RepID=UPI00261D1870|nr:hypothetical protein [uncultured Sulfitobacter sp.]
MIYFARIASLIGCAVMVIGIATIAVMALLEAKGWIPAHLQEQWVLVMSGTGLGAVVLMIGQTCGNDLFKVRGKDSIFALRNRPGDRNSFGGLHAGGGSGGDGGCSD